MKKQLWIILLLLAVAFRAVPAGPAAGEETHVVILGTSDMHGNIWGWSYENDAETSNDGMARLYSYIRQVREENPLTFLIDAGDAIQGTVLTDRLANRNPDDPHPVIAAMNAMGYDAMTLGNHEFDVGVPGLLKILSTADFPVMGQNVLDDQVLTLAVNNFRYSAALKPLNLVSGTPEWQSSEPVQDMIKAYIARSSLITPTVDGNWSITGADLGKDDPRRAELIAWINEGLLPVPYHESCKLADYEKLAAQAETNRK